MGFPILVRWHLYIESGPWGQPEARHKGAVTQSFGGFLVASLMSYWTNNRVAGEMASLKVHVTSPWWDGFRLCVLIKIQGDSFVMACVKYFQDALFIMILRSCYSHSLGWIPVWITVFINIYDIKWWQNKKCIMKFYITSKCPKILHNYVCSGTDQRKYQSSASLAFVRGIHWWPVDSPHKGPVTRKMFLFDDVIMFWLSSSTVAIQSWAI